MASTAPVSSHAQQAAHAEFEPLVRPLPSEFTPAHCFRRLATVAGCVWLDSSLQSKGLSSCSYLAADPFCTVRIDQPQVHSLATVAERLQRFQQPKLDMLPPFQGGWLGWFGYELGGCFEIVPQAKFNEFRLPVAALGMYDVVLSWDHKRQQGWIISQGFPATDPHKRLLRAYARMQYFLQLLEAEPARESAVAACKTLSADRLAPQFPTRWSPAWTSNFSAEGYRQAVKRCVEYIYDGDIFQVNLSQRLLSKAQCPSAELYLHLRSVSPAPFGGYADFGRVQVVSTSPERFLRVENGCLETRPIKGTAPRLSDPTADAGIGEMLRTSPKDRSENIMIVDLLRNDLARVAEPTSLSVDVLCGLEPYPHVWHLVSVIRAQLAAAYSATDVLAATFPGGSITGAPKIRAMQIIAELEPTARGPYCGSLGYVSFAGDMDLSILIRTLTACEGWWQVPVGGGIVAQSEPHLEEQETWHKASGILRAVDSLEGRSI